MDIDEFNALPAAAAADVLRPACASTSWAQVLVVSRPYGSPAEVGATSDGVIAALGWPDVEEALAAHPRIGRAASGEDAEASWSRQEQAGAITASPEITAALRAGNVAYEERFGHVFLISATGRTAEDMLGALTERLENDEETEQRVVRRELAAIVRARLAKLLR